MENTYLASLRHLLTPKGRSIPPWLEDMLLAGPRLELWTPPETRPNRVLVTEFLAWWLKWAGLTQDECQGWLLPYCCEVLKQYSKSGMSMVRHGTKANTRWVYKSVLRFDFEVIAREAAEANPEGLPVHLPMIRVWNEQLWAEKDRIRREYVPPVIPQYIPVKERFREQFEKGVALALEKRAAGMRYTEIVRFLTEQGLLSRTGRRWTMNALRKALFEAESRNVSQPANESPPQSPSATAS